MTDRWGDVFDAWAAAVTEAADEPPPSLYRAPASEAEIVALEERLGTRLPPSYRAFLAHSNGAAAFPGWGVVNHGPTPEDQTGLLPAAEVGWLRDVDRGMVGGIDAFPIDEEIGSARHLSFDSMGSERDYLYPVGTNDPVDAKGGHLRYVLAITVNVDGYMTMLDPLVVDADGEWEAWDYGVKLPGAVRHASFAALLEADTRRARMEIATSAAQRENAAKAVELVADSARPVGERIEAAWAAFSGGARQELVPALAELARSEALDLGPRATAVQLLGYVRTPDAIAVLTEVARDPDPRLRANAIGPLAISDDPAARELAIEILADPSTPGFVLGAVYRPAGPVVWEAYRRSGNKALLGRLAYLGEERAVDDVVTAIRELSPADLEPSSDFLSIRPGSSLLMHAYYLRDPRVAAALADAADRFPTWRPNIARDLVSMGAAEQAVPIFQEAILAGDVTGVAADALGAMDDPRAEAALVDAARSGPTTSLVGALALAPERGGSRRDRARSRSDQFPPRRHRQPGDDADPRSRRRPRRSIRGRRPAGDAGACAAPRHPKPGAAAGVARRLVRARRVRRRGRASRPPRPDDRGRPAHGRRPRRPGCRRDRHPRPDRDGIRSGPGRPRDPPGQRRPAGPGPCGALARAADLTRAPRPI